MQHPSVFDLVNARREVAVPKERQLLAERRRRAKHPVRPPTLNPRRIAEVDQAAGDAVEGLNELGLLFSVLGEQAFDGRFQTLLDRLSDLRRRGSESGAAQQMC